MDSKTLASKARKIIKNIHFYGVLPAHQLPVEIRRFPSGFIANTHTSSGNGQHWVLFYWNSRGDGYFFDSYGQSPSANGHEHWEEYLKRNSRYYWSFNKRRVQAYATKLCGPYCLGFLYLKSRYSRV